MDPPVDKLGRNVTRAPRCLPAFPAFHHSGLSLICAKFPWNSARLFQRTARQLLTAQLSRKIYRISSNYRDFPLLEGSDENDGDEWRVMKINARTGNLSVVLELCGWKRETMSMCHNWIYKNDTSVLLDSRNESVVSARGSALRQQLVRLLWRLFYYYDTTVTMRSF